MSPADRMYLRCLVVTVAIVSCMCLVASSGFLDDETLHIGNHRYAEIIRFPFGDVMPLNTFVNFGYIIVGIYWCRIAKDAHSEGILTSLDCSFFYTFNNMACIYGTVSIIRMVTQEAMWAIVDRWFTLLFFALVPLWSSHIRGECKLWVCAISMLISILSYFLTLILSDFYEIIVGLHILRAIYGGCMAYTKHPSRDCLYYFFGALCSCSLFVSGNLFDMKLPAFSWLFKYISGHCISRIFDAAQIYFTNAFFLYLIYKKIADISVHDKMKWIEEDEELRKKKGSDIKCENHMKRKDI